ncbi:MAG: hypothetical protein ACYS26_00330 [Planctomycetota bacterium]|jgi:hypothetical protein
MRSLLTSSLALLACSAPLQADITVGPEGSGAQTDNINDAIFNADEGETIFVFAGVYQNITINNKSVRIVGAGPDQVTFSHSGDAAFAESSRILGLSEEKQVFISGVRFDSLENTAFNGAADLTGNRGQVFFHDCVFGSTFSGPLANVNLADCDEVYFDQCTVLGFEPEFVKQPIASTGGVALDAERSVVRMNSCTVLGGDSQQPAPFISTGGAGLVLNDSSVLLHNTEVRGGDAFEQAVSPATGSGHAIDATGSDVTITGAPGTVISGGNGFTTVDTSVALGNAAILMVDSSLTYTDVVQVVGGIGSDGSQAEAFLTVNSPVTVELFQRPGLSTSSPSASPGGAFDLLLDGEPSSAHAVALALGAVPAYTLATAFGDVILDPASTTVLAAVALDASGAATLPINVPAEPALSGTVGWFQSLQTGLSGGARVSLPAVLVVGQ